MGHLYLLLFFSLICVHAKITKKPWEYEGTTPFIKEIVLGRCHTYLELSATNRKESLNVDVNCSKLWETFRNVWANKNPCTINAASYKPFFSLISTNKTVKDQLLFYSGLRRLTGDLTAVNDNYFTLEKTISGFVADKLDWCGCVSPTKSCVNGINYGKCSSTCKASSHFWKAASTNFAKTAAGTAYVMMNGTKRGKETAYHKDSYFTRYELPTLGRNGLVKKLVIMVAFDLGVPPKERCGTRSIATLAADAKKYGIKSVRCIDNPRMIVSILCAKFPDAKQCLKR